MQSVSHGISQKTFVLILILMIVAGVAFPLYQLLALNGYIFYLNGLDEASHLSWWYATYVVDESGRMRESSRLVRSLHRLGLSAGYINLLFDICAPACMIVCIKRIFDRLGYESPQARAASIITFSVPVMFSFANPFIEWLAEFHFRPGIVEWLAMPYMSNTPLLRTPEPQISWLLILVIVACVKRASWIPWILIVVSPLLYPFVRLPLLFISVASILVHRTSLLCSLLLSSLFIVGCTMLYLKFLSESALQKFFIFSHLPVISFTGAVAAIVYIATQRHARVALRPLMAIGIASIWLVQNTQLVSGWFVTPVNFEQYWGVMIIAFVAAVVVLGKPQLLKGYVFLGVLCFFVAGLRDFRINLDMVSRIAEPEVVLPALAQSAADMVFDDTYTATVLDMVHPKQAPTAFSWTRTLHASSNAEYSVFQCTKKLLLEQHGTATSERFEQIMEHLARGFVEKGADLNVTMGRMPIPRVDLPTNALGTECTGRNPLIVSATKGSLHQ